MLKEKGYCKYLNLFAAYPSQDRPSWAELLLLFRFNVDMVLYKQILQNLRRPVQFV